LHDALLLSVMDRPYHKQFGIVKWASAEKERLLSPTLAGYRGARAAPSRERLCCCPRRPPDHLVEHL